MKVFIDENKEVYEVEPICKVLLIAPSTYYLHATRQADLSLVPPRAQRDLPLRESIGRGVEGEQGGLRRAQGLARDQAQAAGRGPLHHRAPIVEDRIAETMLAAQLGDRHPRLGLLDESDDLLGGESALAHVRPLRVNGLYLPSAGTADGEQVNYVSTLTC